MRLSAWKPKSVRRIISHSQEAKKKCRAGVISAPCNYDGHVMLAAAVFRPATTNRFMQLSTTGALITAFDAAGEDSGSERSPIERHVVLKNIARKHFAKSPPSDQYFPLKYFSSAETALIFVSINREENPMMGQKSVEKCRTVEFYRMTAMMCCKPRNS